MDVVEELLNKWGEMNERIMRRQGRGEPRGASCFLLKAHSLACLGVHASCKKNEFRITEHSSP